MVVIDGMIVWCFYVLVYVIWKNLVRFFIGEVGVRVCVFLGSVYKFDEEFDLCVIVWNNNLCNVILKLLKLIS